MKNLPEDKPLHWLYRAQSLPRLWWGLAFILAITLGAQLFVHVHAYFRIDGWFGFYALFGFLACAAMVLFARLLGWLLKRPGDYYDHD